MVTEKLSIMMVLALATVPGFPRRTGDEAMDGIDDDILLYLQTVSGHPLFPLIKAETKENK